MNIIGPSKYRLPWGSPRTRLRCGFTLLEVLVVITIVSMLIGLVAPSLKRAREQARDVQCRSRLRGIYTANVTYIHDNRVFPPLNKERDDGAWQYNYLIYDGARSSLEEDSHNGFEYNFGPLINDGVSIQQIEQLFCPVQKDRFHMLATTENPWPVVRGLDTRAGYARRYHLSGKSLSQIKRISAFAADLLHLPKVIKSAHKTGVNVVYSDGHVRWVKDPGILTDNDLSHPFDPLDNGVIDEIWDVLDEAQ